MIYWSKIASVRFGGTGILLKLYCSLSRIMLWRWIKSALGGGGVVFVGATDIKMCPSKFQIRKLASHTYTIPIWWEKGNVKWIRDKHTTRLAAAEISCWVFNSTWMTEQKTRQNNESGKYRRRRCRSKMANTHPRKVAIGINFISICFYSVRFFFFWTFSPHSNLANGMYAKNSEIETNKRNTNALVFQRSFKMQTLIRMLPFY